MDSYFSSESDDEEFYEVPKGRWVFVCLFFPLPSLKPLRLGRASRPTTASSLSATGASPGRSTGLEDEYEVLEGIQESLEDMKAAYETLLNAGRALAGVPRDDMPDWLRAVTNTDVCLPILPEVISMLERTSEEVASARESLCGTGNADAHGQPNKVARLYLSTFALYHTKSAKRFQDLAEGMDKLLMSHTSLPVAVSVTATRSESRSSSPPPPVPMRRATPPMPTPVAPLNLAKKETTNRAAESDEDPFAEQPLADVEASRTRARSRTPQPEARDKDDASARDKVDASAPSLQTSGSYSSTLQESGLYGRTTTFTKPSDAFVSPSSKEQSSSMGLPMAVVPQKDKKTTDSSLELTPPNSKPSSPRNRSNIMLGTVGRMTGRRQHAAVPPANLGTANNGNVVNSAAGPREPARMQPDSLEWGSAERPLKALSRVGDFEFPTDSILRFEVSRKAGLLLSANFSLTVTGGNEAQISIYDVKQQTNVVRPLANVMRVTRSNQDVRKLKIWWSGGDPVERFIFKSGRERERFVEAVWTYRKVVPEALVYAEPVEVFVGTFNLGDAMPNNLDLWLQPSKRFDVYVVSAQEANYDLEKGGSGNDAKNAEQHFFSLIEGVLGEEYVRVSQLSLLHIRMCAYVARKHAFKISNVRKGAVATGIGNVIGNKGGCFVSFSFNETSMCFVGCHLAAREERYEQRCTNVQQIISGINAKQPAGLGPDTWFDYMFWTGDLNYRLTADREQVCKWAIEGDIERLLESDQLMQARRDKKAFYQWTEPPITFSPSYRFDRGSSAFSEEKMRTPSYCDRVLFKSKPGTAPVVTAYDCVHEITTSDHHPVYASMIVDTMLTGVAHSRSPCILEITQLSSKDCTFVALDRDPPVVAFYSSFTKAGKQTRRSIEKGPNLRWDDGSIPKLKPFFSSPILLSMSYLCVALRDGKNEIGQGCISLADACGSQPAEFVVPLVNMGMPAGELRGKVHIKWRKEEEPSSSEVRPALTRGGTQQMAVGVVKKGYMLKQGSKVKSWKRRWFIFFESGQLAYYANPKAPKCLDKLHVDRVASYPGAGKQNCLAVDTGKRRLLFCADNEADYNDWLKVLQEYCASNNVDIPIN